jgi:hypothetical protein
MTIALLDDFFPMEAPPGAHSTDVRWRKMARQWCVPGVVRPELGPTPAEPHPLMVWMWDRDGSATGVPGTVQISTGACWVSGFYGQLVSRHARLVCPPGATGGLVVCRFDPTVQDITFVYRPGVGIGGEARDPTGVWELPLAYLDEANGAIVDLRRFIPLESMAPPITELPQWLPRGSLAVYTGPDTQLDFDFNGGDALVAYVGWEGWFTPGRRLRCSLYCTPNIWVTGAEPAVAFWAADERGEQARHRHQLIGTDDSFSTSFTVEDVQPGLVAVVSAVGGNIRFQAHSCRITIDDAGNWP